jgi:hypothetical protein
MAINTETLKALVENELARTADTRVTTHIRSLLIEPTPVLRDWDYGVKGQQFVCWNALEHGASNTGIAYCESGFGPQTPWGLVVLEGPHMSMGMVRAGSELSWEQILSHSPPRSFPFGACSRPTLLGLACP